MWEIHPVVLLTATPMVATLQFVTFTKPLAVRIPYGTTVLKPGTRLPVVSHDGVRVRHMDQVYAIPLESTDLR